MDEKDLKRLAEHCRNAISKLPPMPVEVINMTERERELFDNFIVPLCGLVQFVEYYIDPDIAEAKKNFEILETRSTK